jgi:hypothetical protein
MVMTQELRALPDLGIAVPADVSFETLNLQLLRGTIVRFNFEVLSRVWIASGLTANLLGTADSAEICCFIARWYAEHVRAGGASDPTYDALIKHLLSEKDSPLRILPA